ncbi:phage tail terminator family protein [Ruminiclostridium cellobioparum]|uniref:phage tail terminator family protein n=1 Tax=Ruminiclostridium cellobioparum TaxID=29355 RepID=UPI0028A86BE4|nr:hypothetical protein [Ruminiclostridium cellobioparum]
MITIEDIMDAINISLLSAFPEHSFYIENIPQNFKRPSFYIQLISDTWEDSNRSTTKERSSFQIIYFGTQNAYGITGIAEKSSVYETVKSLFKNGYIPVKNQMIKLSEQGFRAELRENRVNFTVDFEYFNLREENTQNLQKAKEIIINVKED